jgi:serine/threonine protein kinase
MEASVVNDAADGVEFEGYRVLHEIGSGNSGRVFAAERLGNNLAVAIKLLRRPDEGERGGEAVERFRREVAICARLSHPNIVSLIDSGQTQERLFRELAARGRSTETQMIDTTHIKAHRSASGGDWTLAWRAQYENPRNRRC